MEAVIASRQILMQAYRPAQGASHGALVILCSYVGSFTGSAVVDALGNDGRKTGESFYADPLKFEDGEGKTVYVVHFPCLQPGTYAVYRPGYTIDQRRITIFPGHQAVVDYR